MSTPTHEDLLVHDGPWTESDYLALPHDRRRIELLDGGLLVNPAAGVRHQRLSSRLWLALEASRPAGMEVLEAVNVRVAPGQILIPDLVVTGRPGVDVVVLDPSDVLAVIEIVSPGSLAADRAVKPPLYAASGIATYVRVELSGRHPSAATFRLQEGAYVPASARHSGAVLRLTEPFVAGIDLAALMSTDRPAPPV